eukprot:3755173-Amphidinium_carterae.1
MDGWYGTLWGPSSTIIKVSNPHCRFYALDFIALLPLLGVTSSLTQVAPRLSTRRGAPQVHP